MTKLRFILCNNNIWTIILNNIIFQRDVINRGGNYRGVYYFDFASIKELSMVDLYRLDYKLLLLYAKQEQ